MKYHLLRQWIILTLSHRPLRQRRKLAVSSAIAMLLLSTTAWPSLAGTVGGEWLPELPSLEDLLPDDIVDLIGQGQRALELSKQVEEMIGRIGDLVSGNVLDQYMQELMGIFRPDGNNASIVRNGGHPDPTEMRERLRADAAAGNIQHPYLPSAVAIQGLEALVTGRSLYESVLGEDGQKLSADGLESATRLALGSNQLVTAMREAYAAESGWITESLDYGHQAITAGEQGFEHQSQLDELAIEAQTQTSSQDILKILADQHAAGGQLSLATVNQLAILAEQNSIQAQQMGNQTGQIVQLGSLLDAQTQLQNRQYATLESINNQLAGANLELTALIEAQKGEREHQLINDQAASNYLNRMNAAGHRLMR
ncbi:hypothetical protein ACQ4M4_25535 [Leptolyngbya sp. AN02str]|uniref:hypothetical protein n=1 Tax=Leptolyngbya sp. AN02str TaxID=3423363 RepID=UPI003D31D748